MKLSVCILTAGIGSRMGEMGTNLNKALFPLQSKAIISHIISKFHKDTKFVIALGYLGHQVKDYLKNAHTDSNIEYVNVLNYKKKGSGPGKSLLYCESLLQKEFFFVPCDALWEGKISFDLKNNWVGTYRVNKKISNHYCNFSVKDSIVTNILDKKKYKNSNDVSFTGLMYIKDWKIFWKNLKDSNLKERQVSAGLRDLIKIKKVKSIPIQWYDVGTEDKYNEVLNRFQKNDFSKTNESTYLINNKVIKYFSDENITFKRYKRSQLNKKVFPSNIKIKKNFLIYNFIPGKTLYESNNNLKFKNLLNWLDKKLWLTNKFKDQKINRLCKKFYYDKTMERINIFFKKHNKLIDLKTIQDIKMPSIYSMLDRINWKNLYDGVPAYIHGDLQFDNIISKNQKDFCLIDWRQDFADNLEYGDLYYDLSKMYGGIILNYDLIKKNLMTYDETQSRITFDYYTRFQNKNYLKIFEEFILQKKYDFSKIHTITSLIYLNMASLHTYPFNKLCFSIGKIFLYENLLKNEKL